MTVTDNSTAYRDRTFARFMLPGACIACCGGGKFPTISPVSLLIRAWTGSRFTHIMTVQDYPFQNKLGNWDVIVTQSTIDKVDGKTVSGIQSSLLSVVLASEYYAQGDLVYDLELRDDLQALITGTSGCLAKFQNYIKTKTGIQYDIEGYLGYGIRDIPIIGTRLAQGENGKRMFCSAWRADLLDYMDILRGVNFSQQSPRDAVRWAIHKSCTQIWGPPTPIESDYNTIGMAA